MRATTAAPTAGWRETDDDVVNARRDRQRRNFLATLLLSAGVPMILGGDELGRTQGGNNNAYCQDDEISWFDWSAVDTELLAFTRDLLTLRRQNPALRPADYRGAEGPTRCRCCAPTAWPCPATTGLT